MGLANFEMKVEILFPFSPIAITLRDEIISFANVVEDCSQVSDVQLFLFILQPKTNESREPDKADMTVVENYTQNTQNLCDQHWIKVAER